MKKIKLKTTMAGPGGTYQPGAFLSVEDAEAKDLIAGGYADEVKPKASAKAAAKPAAPKATPAAPPPAPEAQS